MCIFKGGGALKWLKKCHGPLMVSNDILIKCHPKDKNATIAPHLSMDIAKLENHYKF